MENKIISINISPENDEEINENAGVMWEHNATSLVFTIDPSYAGDYRYYIEYRSLIGTRVRTEYLDLNTETNTITYDIPVTMTSLKGVECYFNIVKINGDGETVQIIKPKKFCLQFDYSPDTDNFLARVNDFSINALLEAIRTGAFKGEPGDPIADVDSDLSETSRNPVQNKVIYKAFQNLINDIDKSLTDMQNSMVKLADDTYVAKKKGKGLSTNDFTDAYKEKLDNVDTNPATQISGIVESAEYGGSSVITFNDGNTLTVKNGTKGIDGYVPVKGYDYWTDEDKTLIKDDCNAYINQKLADRTQLTPEYANDISECTDTTRLYVLPDGNIYAYTRMRVFPEITIQGSDEIPEGPYGYWYKNDKWYDLGDNPDTPLMSKRTNLIPVTAGDQLSYKGYMEQGSLVASVVWLGSDMTTIVGDETYDSRTGAVICTAPVGAKYVRFYSEKYYPTNIDSVILEVQWVLCQGADSYKWKNTGHAFVPADYEDEILNHENRIATLEGKKTESVLKGKTIVYDGDSICANGNGYAKIIAETVDGGFVNYAVGGGRLRTQTGSNDSFHSITDTLETIKRNSPNADLYCFEGGVNDQRNGTELGDFDAYDYTGTLDTTTVCGALEYIFRFCLSNFVGKPICFVIAHKCNSTWQDPAEFQQFREKMIGICEKYAIPYFDAWAEGGLNYWCQAHNDNYFTGDGIHPTEEGYKKYYVPQLISLFEKIIPR